ncbi:polysaccharide biosynthesis tyrosine autokinase [Demequina sp. NBRC 110052]|uniref:polysaccharide biosynthesis tyrosine autokinase n=1 Tax=Demequina sp. NBRC 110052 TaxID=1570341 RepID=UPI001356518D|nr:polysaccharide biosynthesis tyrosine autokinase [Demequina sp. NBRC 110052]
MELLDYLRAIRRSWLPLLAATAIGAIAGAMYLSSAPQVYEASTRIVVTANEPVGIQDAQAGVDFASSIAATVAGIIDSPVVLEPAAAALGGGTSTGDLEAMVGVTTQVATGLLTVTVSAHEPGLAADAAATVARFAVEVVPDSVGGENLAGDDALRLEILSQPEPPSQASSPDAKRVLVLTGLIGLGIGLVVAIVRFTRDDRVRTRDDLATHGIGVLGVVPVPARRATAPDADRTEVPASYQELRTRLLQAADTAGHSVLVAPLSATASDAAVPHQLALAFARSNRRTLLVDLDGREQRASRLLELADSPGAMEVLAGEVDPDSTVVATHERGLWALPAGHAAADPADLLERPSLSRLLRWAESQYDTVLVSVPPLLDVADGAIVAGEASQVTLTLRAGADSHASLRAATSSLPERPGVLTGVVLIGAPHT